MRSNGSNPLGTQALHFASAFEDARSPSLKSMYCVPRAQHSKATGRPTGCVETAGTHPWSRLAWNAHRYDTSPGPAFPFPEAAATSQPLPRGGRFPIAPHSWCWVRRGGSPRGSNKVTRSAFTSRGKRPFSGSSSRQGFPLDKGQANFPWAGNGRAFYFQGAQATSKRRAGAGQLEQETPARTPLDPALLLQAGPQETGSVGDEGRG